jgi:hypothetical protein
MTRYLLLIVLLISCKQPVSNWYDVNVDREFDNAGQIYWFVKDEIKYKLTDDNRSLQQVLNDKYGDCRDITLLMLALNYTKLGYKGQLIEGDTTGNGKIDHAIINIENRKYFEIKGKSFKPIRTLRFDEIGYYFYNIY